MLKSFLILLFTFEILFITIYAQNPDPQHQWSMYRGDYANGTLDNANLPQTWNAETGENVAWKTVIPGLGHSSPIVWGDNIFVTTAVSSKKSEDVKTGIYGSINPVPDSSMYEWKLYCLDKITGKILWEKTAHKGIPEQKRHPMSSHANCTPATNGKYVVAFFGSEGLYCYNMDGQLQWKKDFGLLRSNFFLVESAEWEFASSPLIHEKSVIIQCDVAENSFIASFDLATGKERWKQSRDEYPGWCTPNIYYNGEKSVVVVNGFKHRGGYDFETGEEVWKMSGGGDIPIPTPVVGKDLIYFNSAHGKSSPILAIRKNAGGDITLKDKQTSNAAVQWSVNRGGAYMSTVLLYGDYLYNAAWNGRLTCYNAKSGEQMYAEKVGSGNSYTSSPVASDGIIYIADNDGNVYSVQAGPEFKVIHENNLGEKLMTTPAISQNYLFFRTLNHLIAISGK